MKMNQNLIAKIQSILEEKKQLQSENFVLRKRLVLGDGEKKTNIEFEDINGVKFVSKVLDGVPSKDLRGIVDEQKSRIKTGVIVITSTIDKKISIIVGVTEDLIGKFSSISLVKIIAEQTGGKGGGGRPDMAQAGGVDKNKIDKAIESVRDYIRNCV